ncbi:MAG: hypothetical protein KF817_04295 [Phycisphaeraceae bacterium]|nr:hypothetical protein [Phycisphaeraceae bacterium]
MSGQGDTAIGNVVGSNPFNIGVILGLAALVCPIPVHRRIIRIDGPVALGVAILLPRLPVNQQSGRLDGVLLFAGILAQAWMRSAPPGAGGTGSPGILPHPPCDGVPGTRPWTSASSPQGLPSSCPDRTCFSSIRFP